MCACCYGAVRTDITRKPLIERQQDHAFAARRFMCSDEMAKNIEAESFSEPPVGDVSSRTLPNAHIAADQRSAP